MEHKKKRSTPANRAVWAQRIQDWQRSGLSQVAYCRQRNLNASSFYNWRHVFGKPRSAMKTQTKNVIDIADKAAFIPVQLQPTSQALSKHPANNGIAPT